MKTQINSEQLQNDLYYAVRDHDFVQLESLISLGANVNGLIPILGINDNLLAFACRNSNGLEMVKLLVKNHANVNNTNPKAPSSCPLTQAVMSSFEITKFLIESGAEINPNIPFYSPLLLAVDVGQDINTVKLLIEKGANVNELQSSFGRTALHAALSSSKFEMAKILIQNGANINIREHGESAIDLLERFSNNSAQAQELLELVSAPHNVTQITILTPASIVHQPIPVIEVPDIANSEPKWMLLSKKVKQETKYYREPIDITTEDYIQLVDKAGIGSPNGTKVNFEQSGFTYTCTFKSVVRPLVNNSPICKMENNYDNTVVRFTVWDGSTTLGNSIVLESIDYLHEKKSSKFFDYCIKHGQQRYKFGDLVLGSQILIHDENNQRNTPDIKTKSKTFFQNGVIYTSNASNGLDANKTVETNPELDYIYVVDKKGKLFVNTVESVYNHHLFLKGKPEDPCFTYGKEAACGGHLKIKAGKIIEINNMSGHYQPIKDQMKLVAHYFYKQNILANDVVVMAREKAEEFETYTLSDIANFNVGEILAQYNEMPTIEGNVEISGALLPDYSNI